MVFSMSCAVAGIVLAVTALGPATAAGQEIKVTLLGTGCPPPVMDRFARAFWSRPEEESSCSMRVGALCNVSRSSESGGRMWMAYS
jgi:hypothetical protein